jgi:hypothetical protein
VAHDITAIYKLDNYTGFCHLVDQPKLAPDEEPRPDPKAFELAKEEANLKANQSQKKGPWRSHYKHQARYFNNIIC